MKLHCFLRAARAPLLLNIALAFGLLSACKETAPPTQQQQGASPDSIQLTWKGDSLVIGRRRTITARLFGDSAKLQSAPIKWTSSDTTVAVVDANGVVLGLSYGSAVITASNQFVSASRTLDVRLAAVDVGVPFANAATYYWAACALSLGGQPVCDKSSDVVDTVFRFETLPLVGSLSFRTFSTGLESWCGLTFAGELYCWGRNNFGQFGLGTTNLTPVNSPVASAPSMRFSMVAVGGHSTICGTNASDGLLYCWGHNDFYQTGRQPRIDALPDVAPVLPDFKVSEIAIANFTTCALDTTGAPWCWGQGPFWRPVTPTDSGAIPSPERVPDAPSGLHGLSINERFACALESSGQAWCWGSGITGLGTGNSVPGNNAPAPIPNLRFKLLRANFHAGMCGITTQNDVYCWGYYLPLNVSSRTNQRVDAPVLFARGLSVIDIVSGLSRICLITTDNRMHCT